MGSPVFWSIVIILIAVACGVAAHFAWLAHFKLGFNKPGLWIVGGFTGLAFSWIVFSLGTQVFFEEPSNLRQAFITLGLVTKLLGICAIAYGLYCTWRLLK